LIIRQLVVATFSLLVASAAAQAATDTEKCEAARLKLAGKHAQCMLGAEAKGILTAAAADFSKCATKYDTKCAAIQSKYGAACSLSNDCATVKDIAECSSDQLPIPTTTTSTTMMVSCGIDPDVDDDGDGFTGSAGDCDDCDDAVNPGALEIAANSMDDDCDGTTDNALAACDSGLLLASTNALDGASALGLCQQTTAMASTWGVLSASYVRANGVAAVPGTQVGISDSFGTNVAPLEGSRMLVLSSGAARSASQPDACGGVSCPGLGAGTAPMGYPQANAACTPSTSIFDDVALEVQLRVPTNVVGYRYRFNFYTFDYPAWVCSTFNDQYVARVSPAPPGSVNGNISFDNMNQPVSVNFPLRSCVGCPEGTAELAGTGFDTYGASPAAATSWQVTRAPATPGSTITLRFTIYDLQDQTLDSTVLLDGFEWITSGSVFVGTTVEP
jgi:hypothetical protein